MDAPTKKELDLERQLWEERAASINNALQAISFQAQILQAKQQDCQREAARCEAALKSMEAAAS